MARNTFYGLFESATDCLRHGILEGFQRLLEPVRRPSQGEPWLDQVDLAVGGFFAAVAAEPLLAELCLVHSFGVAEGGENPDFEAGVESIAALLSGGRKAAAGARGRPEPPAPTEQFLARTIVSLAAGKVRRGEAATLPDHRGEMVLLVASSYFGIEEGSRMWRQLESPSS